MFATLLLLSLTSKVARPWAAHPRSSAKHSQARIVLTFALAQTLKNVRPKPNPNPELVP